MFGLIVLEEEISIWVRQRKLVLMDVKLGKEAGLKLNVVTDPKRRLKIHNSSFDYHSK